MEIGRLTAGGLPKKLTGECRLFRTTGFRAYYEGDIPKIASLPYIPRNSVLVNKRMPLFVQFGKNAIAFTRGVYWLVDNIAPTRARYFIWEKKNDEWLINIAIDNHFIREGIYVFQQGESFEDNSLRHVSRIDDRDYHYGPKIRRRAIHKDSLEPEELEISKFTLDGQVLYAPVITFKKILGGDL